MTPISLIRPSKLYRYAKLQWNTDALRDGTFRLAPASCYKKVQDDPARYDDERNRTQVAQGHRVTVTTADGNAIPVVGNVTYSSEIATDYYLICFSSVWDPRLFVEFKSADSCLVIHEPDQLCERIHSYVEARLTGWVGIDSEVQYLSKSPLGPAFSKHWRYLGQKEWRFAWYPPETIVKLAETFISIGSIERIAEIVPRPKDVSVG